MKRTHQIAALAIAVIAAGAFFSVQQVRQSSDSRRDLPLSTEARTGTAVPMQANAVPSALEPTDSNDSAVDAQKAPTGSNDQLSVTAYFPKSVDRARSSDAVLTKLKDEMTEQATEDVQSSYTLLFDELDLTPSQKEALTQLLVEVQLGNRTTYYASGEVITGQPVDPTERSNRIAAIIGEPKRERFFALERNLPVYWRVARIDSLMEQGGIPLSAAQRTGLVERLLSIEAATQQPSSPFDGNSIESLQEHIASLDDYNRHVMELAPSVLSPAQVVRLSSYYQYASQRRADSLEKQRELRARDPGKHQSLFYLPDP